MRFQRALFHRAMERAELMNICNLLSGIVAPQEAVPMIMVTVVVVVVVELMVKTEECFTTTMEEEAHLPSHRNHHRLERLHRSQFRRIIQQFRSYPCIEIRYFQSSSS